jgi:hypothetical protein
MKTLGYALLVGLIFLAGTFVFLQALDRVAAVKTQVEAVR